MPKHDPKAIRRRYEDFGVAGYYERHGAAYRNPHEPVVRALLRQAVAGWGLDLTHALDLACGSGEVTLALREIGGARIDGIDPHTGEAYFARTEQRAESFTLEQVSSGALAGRNYSLIVCSFAMHLVDVSWLPALLAQLGLISDRLLILTPHKRPAIKAEWGWVLTDEIMIDRIRARLYHTAHQHLQSASTQV
jgi:SAM-dependent methyltransferase